MPPRDTIHEIVKQAVIKDGWMITEADDPYVKSGSSCLACLY